MQKSLGFTLIELLVVVLIIGILAGVAVPQYRKAVAKARTVRILPLLRALADAEERFYMANGYYVTAIEDIESLDVVWPDKYLSDGKMARWDINGDGVVATYNYRVDMPLVGYFFHYGNTSHPIKGKFYCNGYDSELKAEICRSLGNPVYSWTPHFTYW